MGTRADFYIQKPDQLEWIGSVAWDGYDVMEMKQEHAAKNARNQSCWDVKTARSVDDFTAAVNRYFSHRNDATMPEMGWPWPWDDSCTTDCAYVFDGERTRLYSWGKEVTDDPNDETEGPAPSNGWPNMSAVKRVTFGKRSGVIVLGS